MIVAYSFNFRCKDGCWNTDLEKLNQLNTAIFEMCSITDPARSQPKDVGLVLTSSRFDAASYGKSFIDHYSSRLGVTNGQRRPISFLISTTMDPWLTDTQKGDFLEVVEKELGLAFGKAIDKLNF